MNIHLYTIFYNEKDSLRKQELIRCVLLNAKNPFVGALTVLNEGDALAAFAPGKIWDVHINKRPTYRVFFDLINKKTQPDDINIIANTDIYFDENIEVLKYIDLTNTCLALSRWDINGNGKPILYNHNDSQDVWIFKGEIKEVKGDFPLGVPRCDNRILNELINAGYKVTNPAYSIKAYHLHMGYRVEYTENDNKAKIAPPYRYLYPDNQFNLLKTVTFNIKHKEKLGKYKYDVKRINKLYIFRLFRKIVFLLFKKELPLIGYK